MCALVDATSPPPTRTHLLGLGQEYPSGSGLHFLHCKVVGREGQTKALEHVLPAVRSYVNCLPRAGSEVLHGSAVTGMTFVLPGVDSLDSAAVLV